MWLTRKQAAELCGLQVRQFSDAVQAKLPAEAVRGRGATLRIHAPAAVKVLVEYRLEQAKPLPDETDPLMSGPGTSPNLERYRKEKADAVAMENEQKRGNLIPVQLIVDGLRPAVVQMRGAGEQLARLYGNGAAELHNEAVDEFKSSALRIIDHLKKKDDGGDGDAD